MRLAGIVRGRFRLARNRMFAGARGSGNRGGHPLLAWTLMVALGVVIYFGLASLFIQLADDGASARDSAAVLGLALTAALVGLFVFDLHEAVSTLLLDSDLELLRRAPIHPALLLALKIVDALPRTSSLLVVLALPAVAAYALSYPLPSWAWALLPPALIALWSIPLGIGLAGAILLLRVVPARRAREALGLFSTLTLTLMWIANSLLLPRLVDLDRPLATEFRHAFARDIPGLAWSPGHALAGALAAASAGSAGDAARAAIPLFVSAALALAVATATAARHLDVAQARAAAGAPRGGRRHAGRARFSRGVFGAALARDARLFLRDWTVLGDVITAAVLWTLIPLVGAPLHPAPGSSIARAMLLALTVGLGYEVAARSLPFERQGLAWLRLAPVAPGRWIAAKFSGALLLSLPILAVAAASLAWAFHLPVRTWLEIVCLVVPALALSVSLGLWTGAAFGNPQWTNPRAMLSLSGRILASLLLLTQAALWLVLSGAAHRFPDRLPPGLVFYAPALIALLLAAIPIRAAVARVRTLEWSY